MEASGPENTEHSHFALSTLPFQFVILLSPGGRRFDQKMAAEYAQPGTHLIVLCGHYEGIDQRIIDHLVDDEISIGDYVLTNGALAAAVFTDAVVRLLPSVLGDENSAPDDSFASGLIEGPQYTRPVEFRGWRVPEILLERQPRRAIIAQRMAARTSARENAPGSARTCSENPLLGLIQPTPSARRNSGSALI